jgi:hypothetical protein
MHLMKMQIITIVFTENGNGIKNTEKIFCQDQNRDGPLLSGRRSESG